MDENSNAVFCELSHDELLNVAGGNRNVSTTCRVNGRRLFKAVPAVSVVATPVMGAVVGTMGIALYGAGLLFS